MTFLACLCWGFLIVACLVFVGSVLAVIEDNHPGVGSAILTFIILVFGVAAVIYLVANGG